MWQAMVATTLDIMLKNRISFMSRMTTRAQQGTIVMSLYMQLHDIIIGDINYTASYYSDSCTQIVSQ